MEFNSGFKGLICLILLIIIKCIIFKTILHADQNKYNFLHIAQLCERGFEALAFRTTNIIVAKLFKGLKLEFD